MKKLMKFLMLFAAAAMALTSCDNEGINEGIENNDTYTLTFTAEAPQSRTLVDISGGKADFSWSADDQVGFVQYAVTADKTNRIGSKEITLNGDAATFTTSFDNVTGATAYHYAAYYPYTVPANDQNKTFDNIVLNFPARQDYNTLDDSFDPKADLLMSKTLKNVETQNGHGGVLEFARLVAVAKMAYTLEGAEGGEVVKNVKFSIENAVLSGQVTLDFMNTTAEYATVGNNYVEVVGESVGSEIFFTCFPGEYTGNYTIEVETDKANYTKNGTFAKAFNLSAGNVLTFSATVGGREAKPAELTEDVLNRAFTGISNGSGYGAWEGKTATSGAVYAGQSAGANNSIQLRSSNSNSGVVTTTSGGYVKKIVVAWNSNTASGRILNVYGKNSAYSAATDLYGTAQGTLLGTIVCGTSTELVVNADYQYIGFRSNASAMYLDEVKITWSAEASGNAPVEPEPEPEPETPAGAVTLDKITAAGDYKVEGVTVVATYTDGAILKDATGLGWAYKKNHGLAVGDVVTVEGTVKSYNGVFEFNSPTITKTGTATVAHPTAETWTGAAVEAYISAPAFKYVTVTGTYSTSQNADGTKTYHNLTVDGTSKQVSFNAPDKDYSSLVGKKVVATGYATGGYSNYAYITLTSLSEDGTTPTPDPEPEPEPEPDPTPGEGGGSTEPVTYTLQFGSSYNSKGVSGYTDVSFDSTCNGFTWTIANANNNNNGWSYIKMGSKNGAYTGTITTKTAIPEAIKTVTMTVDAITASKITSIKLYVANNTNYTNAQTISVTPAQGQLTFTVPTPTANCYYKIEVVCQKASSNGPIQISKVVYTNN